MMKLLLLLPALVLFACTMPSGNGDRQRQQDSAVHAMRMDSLRTATLQDSLRDGHHVIHSADGKAIMEGDMLRGKRSGLWTSYTEKGRVKSRNEYLDGVLNGPSIVFRDNGAVYYQGQYRNGKEVGQWTFNDTKGQLVKTLNYDSTGTVINDR